MSLFYDYEPDPDDEYDPEREAEEQYDPADEWEQIRDCLIEDHGWPPDLAGGRAAEIQRELARRSQRLA